MIQFVISLWIVVGIACFDIDKANKAIGALEERVIKLEQTRRNMP